MDPSQREKKAAVQRSHAILRARERYDLYIDNVIYDDIRYRCQRAVRGEGLPITKVLGVEGQEPMVYVIKLLLFGEWLILVYDAFTNEIRTFLPPNTRYVKGMSVESA